MGRTVQENGNWIDLSELTRYNCGTYEGKIDWEKSINSKIKFKYNNIESVLIIVDYNKKKQLLTLSYDNADVTLRSSDIIKDLHLNT